MKAQTTQVLWVGPSRLDPSVEIFAVATNIASKSANEKTGDMVQVWYMPVHVKPNDAVKTGEDAAVCGNCPLRPLNKASRPGKQPCYVLTHNAPRSIWASVHRNGLLDCIDYDRAASDIKASGKEVRFGGWGDPAAVPVWVNTGLIS